MKIHPILVGHRAALVAASAVLVLSAPRAEALPIQWAGNGHYYDLVALAAAWPAADAAASASTFLGQQGHLATLTSSAEDAWVFANVVQPAYGPSEVAGPWLGGFQAAGASEPSAGWAWVTGEPWSYAGWHAGQPDDGAGGPPEGALQVWSNLNGGWNDAAGSRQLFYVVEYENSSNSVPEPGTLLLLGGGLAGLTLRRRRTS